MRFYKRYINKLVKSLNESDGFFDDFYDDDDIEYNDVIDTAVFNLLDTKKRLIDCYTDDDVREYLFEKINGKELVENLISNIYMYVNNDSTYSSFSDIFDDDNISVHQRFSRDHDYIALFVISINELNINDVINVTYKTLFELTVKSETTPFVYRNKNVDCAMVYVNDTPMFVKNEFGYHQKLKDLITNYNNGKYHELQLLITDSVINNIFNPSDIKRITDELTCEPKEYKVVQKDIDRMKKCYETGNYAGFDAINKPEKMVARLAALLIVIYKQGHLSTDLSNPIKFDENVLLRIFLKNKLNDHYRTRYTYYSNRSRRYGKKLRWFGNDPESILRIFDRLSLFPTIHLKDVLAAYNKYKDQL